MEKRDGFAGHFRAYVTDRIYVSAAFIVALVFAVAGAFDSTLISGFPWRLVFWLSITYGSMAAVIGFSSLLEWRNPRLLAGDLQRAGIAGILASFVMGPLARLLLGVFSGVSVDATDLALTVAKFLAVLPLVSVIVARFCQLKMEASERERERLALEAGRGDKAGPCGNAPIYLEAEDHYVKLVFKDRVEVRRMTLAKAAQEWMQCGERIHRSYWVASRAIDTTQRNGRQLVLRLKNGTQLPVGRSFEKGLLERLRGEAAD